MRELGSLLNGITLARVTNERVEDIPWPRSLAGFAGTSGAPAYVPGCLSHLAAPWA